MTRLLTALLLARCVPIPAHAAPEARLVVQRGHSDVIRNVAYSPDGKLVFTASEDSVIAWTHNTLKKLYEISVGRIRLRAIAFVKDADRTTLLTVGESFSFSIGRKFAAALWDIETGTKVRDLPYQFIDACEDGSMLWVQESRTSSSIRDAATGRTLANLPFGAASRFMFTFATHGMQRRSQSRAARRAQWKQRNYRRRLGSPKGVARVPNGRFRRGHFFHGSRTRWQDFSADPKSGKRDNSRKRR